MCTCVCTWNWHGTGAAYVLYYAKHNRIPEKEPWFVGYCNKYFTWWTISLTSERRSQLSVLCISTIFTLLFAIFFSLSHYSHSLPHKPEFYFHAIYMQSYAFLQISSIKKKENMILTFLSLIYFA